MMLAGLPVAPAAVAELVALVRDAGAADLADRLDHALDEDVKLLALTIDERAIILAGRQPTGSMGDGGVGLSGSEHRERPC